MMVGGWFPEEFDRREPLRSDFPRNLSVVEVRPAFFRGTGASQLVQHFVNEKVKHFNQLEGRGGATSFFPRNWGVANFVQHFVNEKVKHFNQLVERRQQARQAAAEKATANPAEISEEVSEQAENKKTLQRWGDSEPYF